MGQWVDEVWSRNFGATSQAILKTKPFEFSPEDILKMDQDALRNAASAYLSDVMQREGLDFTTDEGHQRAQMVLSSFLNQAMQEAMGIKFYIWASQHDKRVRTAHAERDGKIFRWDTPPEGGHPSQDFGCRCYAQPLGIEGYFAHVHDVVETHLADLNRWERSVDYMYQDTGGNMTVGIGTKLPNSASAAVLPFRYRNTGGVASEAEVVAEFDEIAALPHGRDYAASYYAPYAQLYVSQAAIEVLKREHVRADFPGLVSLYPFFGNLPDPVQLALLDILYNVGLGGLAGFPLMQQAILRGDWEEAARQSHRGGDVSKERNDYVFNLFMDAADSP